MTWKWWDYFDLANDLFSLAASGNPPRGTSEEACYRACISRAYYATFHRAWSELSAKFQIVENRTGGSHEKVIDALREYENAANVNTQREIRTVGEDLADLKKLRKTADYKPILKNPQGGAMLALQLARQIDERLVRL